MAWASPCCFRGNELSAKLIFHWGWIAPNRADPASRATAPTEDRMTPSVR
jgi:hypothetical protein